MAIATLALCYNNKEVFQKMVKIRKGEAVQLIMQSTTLNSVHKIMLYYTKEVTKNELCIVVINLYCL